MAKNLNGDGTLYKTLYKVLRDKRLNEECKICKDCENRQECNNREGGIKCKKCKECKVECLNYCDRFYCYEKWVAQATVNGKKKKFLLVKIKKK